MGNGEWRMGNGEWGMRLRSFVSIARTQGKAFEYES
jgi:hypothetical protein